jgi:hypothetical protein
VIIIIIIAIIVIIIAIIFMQDISIYIPATNPVPTVHTVAAVLDLQFGLHLMLFHM